MPLLTKPPLGILPHYLWRESLETVPSVDEMTNRLEEIENAIYRYGKAEVSYPIDWDIEYRVLQKAIIKENG